jgi:hypothetical protein
MISTVTIQTANGPHEIKLSAAAMYRIEMGAAGLAPDGTRRGIAEVLQDLCDFSVVSFANVFSECMDGGKGASVDAALEMMDDVGFAAAMAAFQRATEMPFQEAAESAPGKATAATAGGKTGAA